MAQTFQWQTSAGGSAIDLAVDADAVSEFRVGGQQLVQPQPALRAGGQRSQGRGNLSVRISFQVALAPVANAEAARAFATSQTVALKASLLTHSRLEYVFGSTTWRLNQAALETFEFWQNGITPMARYVFSGAELVAA